MQPRHSIPQDQPFRHTIVAKLLGEFIRSLLVYVLVGYLYQNGTIAIWLVMGALFTYHLFGYLTGAGFGMRYERTYPSPGRDKL